MWKHNNFINLQLHAPASWSLTFVWDGNIESVVLSNSSESHTYTASGERFTLNYGTTYTITVNCASGYILDTISGVDYTDKTDNSFIIDATGKLEEQTTITLRSKASKLKTADILKSIKTHVQEAYTALENKSATIPTNKNIENLKTTIESVSTGIDTSDATATNSDILSPKTAYAKGEKLTGSIIIYGGEYEDIVVYDDCLTFTGETSEFKLKATFKEWDGTLQWSTDHTNWTTLAGTEAMQSANRKLYLRGSGNTKFYTSHGVRWVLSAKAGCSGNINTLLQYDNPPTTLASNCYDSMFRSCTYLTTAPELPATTLAESCYASMFDTCGNLATAPKLPATTLASNCYHAMFYNCTYLITVPELPAITLAANCYRSMFSECTRLRTPPELPATTLASNCYDNMFYNCTNLIACPELPATTLESYCYRYMFYRCTKLKVNTSSGTKIFTCPSTIPSGAVNDMFYYTGGSFKGTPTAGNTYYYTL